MKSVNTPFALKHEDSSREEWTSRKERSAFSRAFTDGPELYYDDFLAVEISDSETGSRYNLTYELVGFEPDDAAE